MDWKHVHTPAHNAAAVKAIPASTALHSAHFDKLRLSQCKCGGRSQLSFLKGLQRKRRAIKDVSAHGKLITPWPTSGLVPSSHRCQEIVTRERISYGSRRGKWHLGTRVVAPRSKKSYLVDPRVDKACGVLSTESADELGQQKLSSFS